MKDEKKEKELKSRGWTDYAELSAFVNRNGIKQENIQQIVSSYNGGYVIFYWVEKEIEK